MKKLLFFDYRELEHLKGFTRAVESPVKHPDAPLMTPDLPWEHGNMQMFGSVLRAADGRFRAWYEVVEAPWTVRLAYAESDDGLRWHKPQLNVFKDGRRPTNIVFDAQPLGSAVIEDRQDPRPAHRYKLLTAAEPSGCVAAFHSADGMFIGNPRGRSPIGSSPSSQRRRTAPSASCERRMGGSWPITAWPGMGDGSFGVNRGTLRIGPASHKWCWSRTPATRRRRSSTAWAPAPTGPMNWARCGCTPPNSTTGVRARSRGLQTPELAYARAGTAWHRAAPGTAFIANGAGSEWDCGNLQPASQPVFLDDEIRYYYAGTNVPHSPHWELGPQDAGLGMARLKPDRFVALAGDRGAGRTGDDRVQAAIDGRVRQRAHGARWRSPGGVAGRRGPAATRVHGGGLPADQGRRDGAPGGVAGRWAG